MITGSTSNMWVVLGLLHFLWLLAYMLGAPGLTTVEGFLQPPDRCLQFALVVQRLGSYPAPYARLVVGLPNMHTRIHTDAHANKLVVAAFLLGVGVFVAGLDDGTCRIHCATTFCSLNIKRDA